MAAPGEESSATSAFPLGDPHDDDLDVLSFAPSPSEKPSNSSSMLETTTLSIQGAFPPRLSRRFGLVLQVPPNILLTSASPRPPATKA